MQMIIADWVAVGAVALFLIIGVIVGFGKGLKFFTSGVFGVLISIFVCYCIGGLILQLEFVQTLLGKLVAAMEDKGGFCDFLIDIHIELIVYYVALFAVVQIVRVIIVAILKNIAEINNIVFKIINKIFGAALFLCALAVIVLIVFQIISIIGGNTSDNFSALLEGSVFKLDKLYANNPLLSLIEMINKSIPTG